MARLSEPSGLTELPLVNHDYLAKAVVLLVDPNAAHDSLPIRNAADALAAAVEARSDEAA
jgi:hypothetical protein